MTDKHSVKAVLDIHEPEAVHDALKNHPDVESVKLAPLPSADMSIAGVGFERKTVSDYVNSMTDGRLAEQIEKLGSAYVYSHILIDGDMEGTEDLYWSDMAPESIRGHMASVTARDKYDVEAVIPCGNTALLADYAVRLARKHVEDPSVEYLPTGAVGSDEPPGKQMWGCLPHVGPELAERLWQSFGPPTIFISNCAVEGFSEAEELLKIDGIGPETAADIVEALLEGE